MARLIDNTVKVTADLEAEVGRRVLAAAVLLQAEHKADLGRSFPPASTAGQFPHGRTWNLRDAVAIEKVDSVTWRVGYLKGAAYIVHLAKKGRKTVADTAVRVRRELERLIRRD